MLIGYILPVYAIILKEVLTERRRTEGRDNGEVDCYLNREINTLKEER